MGDLTRSAGIKVRHSKWSKEVYFEPIYLSQEHIWHGLNDSGEHDSYDENAINFELWSPEKNKIKLYKWAIKLNNGDWCETTAFYKEGKNPALDNHISLKRLDYTMIEDEE